MDAQERVRFELSKYGQRPGTRLEGERAREAVEAALAVLPEDGQLVISLDGLDILSGTFADEAIVRPYAKPVSKRGDRRTMIVEAPSEDLTEDLSRALVAVKLAMLAIVEGRWRVLGFLSPLLTSTLAEIMKRRTTTAKEIARVLGITPTACHQRIARLAEMRLIRLEETGKSAPNTRFIVSSILEG